MAEEIKKDEDWMQKKWRPAMGWMYMVVCMMDMVIFPVLWSLLQAAVHGNVSSQWQPLTLQGAGLFHLAMGAVLGIAAFGRTQEKIAGSANNISTPSLPSAPMMPAPVPMTQPFYAPTSYAPSSFSAPVATGFGGKTAPPPAYQPEL
jgi:hypothetical protein